MNELQNSCHIISIKLVDFIFLQLPMDPKANIRLIPAAIKNFSCAHPRYDGNIAANVGPKEMIQASFIIFLTFLIVGANFVVIIVINSRKYQAYLHPQVRLFGFRAATNHCPLHN